MIHHDIFPSKKLEKSSRRKLIHFWSLCTQIFSQESSRLKSFFRKSSRDSLHVCQTWHYRPHTCPHSVYHHTIGIFQTGLFSIVQLIRNSQIFGSMRRKIPWNPVWRGEAGLMWCLATTSGDSWLDLAKTTPPQNEHRFIFRKRVWLSCLQHFGRRKTIKKKDENVWAIVAQV